MHMPLEKLLSELKLRHEVWSSKRKLPNGHFLVTLYITVDSPGTLPVPQVGKILHQFAVRSPDLLVEEENIACIMRQIEIHRPGSL